jgi:Protein of unknown function (DUF1592)/Protein of unknown function (DUF1588)/Protein of unknown function (DUF1587)/Protein of unknown function (DUF1595)/Protein of unknown function (DUF1585)
MLGLKLTGGLGRRAGHWLLPLTSLLLAACSSTNDNGAAGSGGSASGGATSAGGTTSVTPPATASQVGLITLRRLNRVEYGNTLRDLIGTTKDHGQNFPPENLSFGFDNIGEALTIQPLHVELYEQSAEAVLGELFARPAADPWRLRVLSCDATAGGRPCILQMLVAFAQYAYRRPVLEPEVTGLADIAEDFVATGGTIDEGLKWAFKGVLLSPHFIYRVELDADPTSKVPHRVSGFELASRLSYYLWSTMPDQPLLFDAQLGKLDTDAGLSAQVERMLADPRSSALVSNFVGQWLNLRRTEQVTPDYTVFPTFDDELKASLKTESERFFAELLQKSRPISELLTGTFTYVNARLAKHYGMPTPTGSGFQRVDLAGSPRLGFLTHGSFLTATSNPTRTSPVKRGKWVLDQLLCSPPPPPPPGVDSAGVDDGAASVRQRLEQHRAKEPCRSCHAVMDPIGLSFENYDGIGAYRTADQYGPIDATGKLPTPAGDVAFLGANELVPILATDERLADCVAEKVLTYAVGRGFTASTDPETMQAITEATAASGKGFRGMFASVALAEAFRSRRAVGE